MKIRTWIFLILVCSSTLVVTLLNMHSAEEVPNLVAANVEIELRFDFSFLPELRDIFAGYRQLFVL